MMILQYISTVCYSSVGRITIYNGYCFSLVTSFQDTPYVLWNRDDEFMYIIVDAVIRQ